MDMFKSKLGMAIGVQVTLIASLCLAVGICAYFGLRPLHSRGKYVYPVLAGLVGFENSMVLIRSILSTAVHLDVKIRVAQGLSREGWTITKYFLAMITLSTISFFSFIPLVQEISIYGGLVLLSDLFFQLVFLTAVLSVDLHRYVDSEQHRKQTYATAGNYLTNPLFRYPGQNLNSNIKIIINQAKRNETSVLNLHRRHPVTNVTGEDRLATPKTKPSDGKVMPRRLRVTYYFARKRMFQRIFMCVFVGWIAWLVTEPGADYHWPKDLASVILTLTNRSLTSNQTSDVGLNIQQQSLNIPHDPSNSISLEGIKYDSDKIKSKQESIVKSSNYEKDSNKKPTETNEWRLLKHHSRSFLRRLPHTHWPTLFSYYNISLRGNYLSMLPPILLSIPVTPEDARAFHHPQDPNNVPWSPQNTHKGLFHFYFFFFIAILISVVLFYPNFFNIYIIDEQIELVCIL